MKHLILLLIALSLANSQVYNVSITCPQDYCTANGQQCTRCMYLNGGPFDNNYYCVADKPQFLPYCDFGVTFDCSSSYSCPDSMSFSITYGGQPIDITGCTLLTDPNWVCQYPSPNNCTLGVREVLDQFYSMVIGYYDFYDWYKPCIKSPINGLVIAIVVAGVIVIIAVIIIACACYRRTIKAIRTKPAVTKPTVVPKTTIIPSSAASASLPSPAASPLVQPAAETVVETPTALAVNNTENQYMLEMALMDSTKI